jgi:hypothetical protein
MAWPFASFGRLVWSSTQLVAADPPDACSPLRNKEDMSVGPEDLVVVLVRKTLKDAAAACSKKSFLDNFSDQGPHCSGEASMRHVRDAGAAGGE